MANATKPRYWHINLDMSTEMEFDQMSQPRKAIIKLTAEHHSFSGQLSSEPQGTILLVMQDKKPKMLCKMIDDAPHTKEEAKEKGVYSVKRKVEIIGDIPSDWQDPKATWFRQRCGDCTSRSVQQYPYIQRILDHLSKTDPMPHMSEPAKKPLMDIILYYERRKTSFCKVHLVWGRLTPQLLSPYACVIPIFLNWRTIPK